MNNKKIFLSIFLIFFILSISVVSASDNGTQVSNEIDINKNIEETDIIFVDNAKNDEVLSLDSENSTVGLDIEEDVYFNASASRDGDGSRTYPFKYVTPDRLPYGCTAYFADGIYEIDRTCYLRSNDGSELFDVPTKVTFYGESTVGTIFKCTNSSIVPFCVDDNSRLYAYNMTFDNAVVQNNGRFEAYGIIFKNGVAVDIYASYYPTRNNAFGGAIYSPGSHYATYGSGMKSYLTIVDCLFMNNSAVYGGSIYHDYGDTIIKNTKFYDSYSSLYGGVLATDGGTIKIENCEFFNCGAAGDAGGAIYSKTTDLTIRNANFTNGYGDFGGAICNLNSNLILENINFANNTAKYEGGAIYAMYGNVTIKNCDVFISSALDGGALFVDNCSSVDIKDTKFDKSTAKRYGGTIFSNGNEIVLENVEFGESLAAIGPVIYHQDKYDYDIGANTDYMMMVYNSSYAGVLPSRFDLRELGYVTPIRDQQAGGNCWAFAGIAALESCILKATGKNLDLSEENMKNLVELYSAYGWKYDTNGGGHSEMSWGHFISWLGPVLEENDVYDDYSTLSTLFDAVMHVQNVYYLPARENALDNDAIKKAIMDYGAVSVGIYWDDSPLNWDEKTASYFLATSTSAYPNHAVTIVGWDDNYDKNNFPMGDMADTNGAWIVKNSWGEDWGDNGYFYVSYYDPVVYAKKTENDVFTYILNDTVKYNRNYQYDIGGMTDFLYPEATTVYYKNTFNAIGNDILTAFSTVFVIENDYEAKIYINDELKLTQKGHSFGGYATIPLTEEFQLNSGDNFTIEIKVSKESEVGFPICEVVTATRLTYGEGISFFSLDGKNWNDLYTFTLDRPDFDDGHRYSSQVACIKAFTRASGIVLNSTIEVEDVETNVGEPTEISAIIKDENGKLIHTGFVTFDIDGTLTTIKVENGRASVEYEFASEGIVNVKASYDGVNIFSNSTDTAKVNVDKAIEKKDAEFNAFSNNDAIVYGDALTLMHQIDPNATGKVSFYDGEKLLGTVNVGNSLYDVKLTAGKHTITANYSGSKHYKKASVEIVVEVAKNGNYKFIVNGEGNTITVDVPTDATGNVKVVISGKEYESSISNGKAIIEAIDLEDGDYKADISYVGDNNYESKSSSINLTVDNVPDDVGSDISVILRDINYPKNSQITVEGNYTPIFEYYVTVPEGYKLVNDLIIICDGVGVKTISDPIDRAFTKLDIDFILNETGKHNFTLQYKYWIWGGDGDDVDGNVITYNVISSNQTGPVQNQTNDTIPVENNTNTTNPIENKTNDTAIENNTDISLTILDVKYPNDAVINIVGEYAPVLGYYIVKPTGNLLIDEIVIMCDGVDIQTIENPIDSKFTRFNLNKLLNETGTYAISAVYKYYILQNGGGEVKSKSISYLVNVTPNPIENNTNPIKNDTNASVPERQASEIVVNGVDDKGNIFGVLKDSHGKPISGEKIRYVADGVESTVITSSDGSFKINALNKSKVSIIFDGNNNSLSNNLNVSFKNDIIPKNVKIASRFNFTSVLFIKGYAVDVKAGEEGMTYVTQLVDANGKPIANAHIQFALNSKIYDRITSKNGSFTPYHLNMIKAARYTLAFSYLGDDTYNGTLGLVCVDLYKKPITIKASSKSFKASAKTKKYTISLSTIVGSSADGKAHLSPKTVTLKVNGKTYTAKTKSNGKATFKLKLTKKAKYNAEIIFKGDNTYDEATKNVKITIR